MSAATPTAQAAAVLVLAYRRKAEDKFESVIFGCRVKFAANAEGHVVGAVPADRADVIARLVEEIPEAYILYTGEGVSEDVVILTPKDTEPPKPKFVIVTKDDGGNDQSVDLKAMDDTTLKAFVKANKIPGIAPAAKGDKLRTAICRAVGQAVDENGAFVPTEEDIANQ